MNREEWLKERKRGIGGSDVGSLYNLDFGCRKRLYYDKSFAEPDFPKDETPELERGTIMEFACRAMYEKRTRRKIEDVGKLIRHPEQFYSIAHVDGITNDPIKGEGVVEFKVVNRFIMRQFKKTGVRESYILQLQHMMACGGYKWGSFGLLCLDPWEFEWFDCDADPEMQAKLIEDEGKFWMQLYWSEIPESLSNINDKRCAGCEFRRKCRGEEFLSEAKIKEGEELVSRNDLTALVQECVELGDIKDQAAELETEAREKLKVELGSNYGITCQGYRVLKPSWTEERWDTKALNALEKRAPEVEDWFSRSGDMVSTVDKALSVIRDFLKCRKPPTTKSSMRIYPTGD